MSTIGGPGGIGGPKGPGGPDGPDGPDGVDELDELTGDAAVDETHAAARLADVGETSDIDALASEVAAGRLTPHEALDRLVAATAGPDLGPAERAELRELLSDLVGNDPYLGSLVNRI